jgi:hypothetical protein
LSDAQRIDNSLDGADERLLLTRSLIVKQRLYCSGGIPFSQTRTRKVRVSTDLDDEWPTTMGRGLALWDKFESSRDRCAEATSLL